MTFKSLFITKILNKDAVSRIIYITIKKSIVIEGR